MKVIVATLAFLALAPISAFAADQTAPATAPAAAPAQELKTVEGPVAKVVARKKEIYVQGPDKKYEFYFTPKTELVKGGQPVEFSVLTEGTKVKVSYATKGKRLDPVKVEVLP